MILYSLFALFAPHCKTVIEVTENEIKAKESIWHDYDKLPARAYQKLNPFDMIKFGLSIRYYVMRCPSL